MRSRCAGSCAKSAACCSQLKGYGARFLPFTIEINGDVSKYVIPFGFLVTDRPQTLATQRAALEQKMQRWDPSTEFWYDALQKGQIPNLCSFPGDTYAGLASHDRWPTSVPRQALYGAHREWCREHRKLHPANDSAFAKKLRKLCPNIGDSRPTTGRRERHCVLPSLG